MDARMKLPDCLSRQALFASAGPAELTRLAAATSVLRLARGDVLFRAGEACLGVHVLVYGQVKLSSFSPLGGEKVLEIVGAGECIGEAPALTGEPYPAAAHALADCLLLLVERGALCQAIESNRALARAAMARLGRRVHTLIGDIESLSLRSGSQRVVDYLLHETARPPGLQVRLPAAKSVIASRLNLSPEHFSRILGELAQRELIRVRGRQVAFLQIERLRNYCG